MAGSYLFENGCWRAEVQLKYEIRIGDFLPENKVRFQGLQVKPSVITCDCQAAYVKRLKTGIFVVVAPDL